MHDVMESVLNQCLGPTNEMILNLIEIETSLINTNHPDFIGSADAMLNLFQDQDQQSESGGSDEDQQRNFSLMKKDEPAEKPEEDGKREEEKKGWMSSLWSRGTKQEQPLAESQATQRDDFEVLKDEKPSPAFSFENPKIDQNGNLPEVILEEVPVKLRSHANQESSRVIMETRVIQNLIQSYFGIVKKNTADLVPKTIMALLVNESKTMAQNVLVQQVYQANDLEDLLVEDPIMARNRAQCKQMIEALRTAQGLLSEVT